jgi:uncharacterized protein (DUF1684 family)
VSFADTTALWDWRCRVADLYADIRRMDNPRAAWALWCRTRDELFAQHPQSPLPGAQRSSFVRLPIYPYDPALRCVVRLVPADGDTLALPAGDDGEVHAAPFAKTDGLQATLGGELTLYWLGGYGGGVFLPFTDATTGVETYGGGRYLLDTIKSADLGRMPDGRIVLDFNFAYAPSCAHSPEYVCPLAPPCNRLPELVRGGERL